MNNAQGFCPRFANCVQKTNPEKPNSMYLRYMLTGKGMKIIEEEGGKK